MDKQAAINQQQIALIHQQAVAREEMSYVDPVTGYQVWTALYLKQQGTCCDSGCRHCPYGSDP
ncbi:MAG: hypothetical protein KTR14_05100 [Vampirovibrio sp.]|nr:hypothetical protein [Vampirovibrio sp.]